MENILVSIICNTYNHEKYIAKALDGFLMQKTSFQYEILVHDDASTDRTADIIREYEKKYPDRMFPIYQTENQYSKRDGSIGRIQYGRVRGKYIAVCEGDDYWTDPLKLQKQYEAMEQHPEADMCAHGTVIENAVENEIVGYLRPAEEDRLIPLEEVIAGGGGYVATCSLFYRAGINREIPAFRKNFIVDYTLQIHGALRGGMLYLSENMAVYRKFVKGSWTVRTSSSTEKVKQHYKIVDSMLSELDRDTGYQYTECIQNCRKRHEFHALLSTREYRKVMKHPCFRELPFKVRLKTAIKRLIRYKQ